MGKRILIRLNAGKEIGLGHLNRMLGLAKILKNEKHQIEFLINKNDPVQKNISQSGFAVKQLAIETSSEEMQKLSPSYQKKEIQLINQLSLNHQAEVVIFDLLNTSAEYIDFWKNQAKILISFDNISPSRKKINLVVNALCHLPEDYKLKNVLVGHQYLLLKKSVYLNRYQFNDDVKDILIIFGGADLKNLTLPVLHFLKKDYQSFNFHIVVGMANSKIKEIKDYCLMNKLNFYFDVKNLELMSKHYDLAICNGGITLYELLCQGVPTLMLRQVDNEYKYTTLPKGIVINLGLGQKITKNKFKRAFDTIVTNNQLRKKMHQSALKEFSINHYNHLVKKISSVINKGN